MRERRPGGSTGRADLRTGQPRPDPGGWEAVGVRHPGLSPPGTRRRGDWAPATNALVAAFAALGVVASLWSATTASPVGEVRGWQRWCSAEIPLSLEHPSGWRAMDLASGAEVHLVVARSEWVRLHLIAEPGLGRVLSLTQQMPGGRGAGAQYGVLERLHEHTGETWQMLFRTMQEGAVGRTVISRRPAVWSRFNYENGLLEHGEPMTGYRATILAGRRAIIVSAVAPTEHWRDFEPIALHMLGSIDLGDSSSAGAG